MAKEIANDKVTRIEIYYDAEAAAWKAEVRYTKCESTDADFAKSKQLDMDLTGGTLQADVDALAAEALTQAKSEEGIV